MQYNYDVRKYNIILSMAITLNIIFLCGLAQLNMLGSDIDGVLMFKTLAYLAFDQSFFFLIIVTFVVNPFFGLFSKAQSTANMHLKKFFIVLIAIIIICIGVSIYTYNYDYQNLAFTLVGVEILITTFIMYLVSSYIARIEDENYISDII